MENIIKVSFGENTSLKDKIFNYMLCLLSCNTQLRINHWQTIIYSEHKLIDKLIDDLNDLIDKLAEATIGRLERPQLETYQYIITDMRISDTKFILDKLKKETYEIFQELNITCFEDLKNIVADIEGIINKTLYLLTLE